MADEEEEEEKEESPKRDPIQNPHHATSSQSLATNLNDLVFPPINHEGLHHRTPLHLFEPVTSPPPPPEPAGGFHGFDVARRCAGQLRVRVLKFVSWVWNFRAPRRANRSFVVAVTAAFLVWWVYVAAGRRRRRVRVREESRDYLVLLIREKDEVSSRALNERGKGMKG